MSLAYRILYAVGFTPWEQMGQPPISDQIARLFDREENERGQPGSEALDLGCGSGIWAVRLAARGWRVTGIDAVPKALRRASHRARQAGVDLTLVKGDVIRLGETGVGSGFSLFLDFGLFHDELSDDQRRSLGREVNSVAAPDATLLIMAWEPGRRGPLPRGASRADIEAAYPDWRVADEEPMDVPDAAPGYVKRANPRFYRLRRG